MYNLLVVQDAWLGDKLEKEIHELDVKLAVLHSMYELKEAHLFESVSLWS